VLPKFPAQIQLANYLLSQLLPLRPVPDIGAIVSVRITSVRRRQHHTGNKSARANLESLPIESTAAWSAINCPALGKPTQADRIDFLKREKHKRILLGKLKRLQFASAA